MPAPAAADRYRSLLDDLAAEQLDLDLIVASLSKEEWDRPTPSKGWSVRDQIGHLYYFDGAATRSVVDPEAFIAERDALIDALTDSTTGATTGETSGETDVDAHTLAFARGAVPEELLAAWRQGRLDLLAALSKLDGSERLEWYGPPMGAMSFATARLMETWAHAQDVADAVAAVREATGRLRHIAHLGVRTRGFSYAVRGRELPGGEVRVELTAPSGEVWEWGGAELADRVTGDALDFCLVVTQRRHVAEVGLAVEGPLAEEWISIAQAFAGPPSPGRPAPDLS